MVIFKYGDKIETKDSCLPKLTGTVLGQDAKTGLVKFRCRERHEIMSVFPENIQHRPAEEPGRSELTSMVFPQEGIDGEFWVEYKNGKVVVW